MLSAGSAFRHPTLSCLDPSPPACYHALTRYPIKASLPFLIHNQGIYRFFTNTQRLQPSTHAIRRLC